MASFLESDIEPLAALMALECGLPLRGGVAEVVQAIDACRGLGQLAQPHSRAAGPTLRIATDGPFRERKVVVCISSSSSPLAGLTRLIAAALANGSAVVAVPADQTNLVAARAVELFHAAGLEPGLLALLPGDPETLVPRLLRKGRPCAVSVSAEAVTVTAIGQLMGNRAKSVPLVSDAPIQRVIVADECALGEDVISDIVASGFGPANACSTLPLSLHVPEEIADEVVARVASKVAALRVGDPCDPHTDIGPVIDFKVRNELDAHVERLKDAGYAVFQRDLDDLRLQGSFFAPAIAYGPAPLPAECTRPGPILHVHGYLPGECERLARDLASRDGETAVSLYCRSGSDTRLYEMTGPVRVGKAAVRADADGPGSSAAVEEV
jgi:RHH-type proline utilization regulon transcriptional repressor/proline dehydrogenase/delta 1-pyrroline-5-carboxylate dehydrogenase